MVKDEPKKITKTELKKRGWTEALMEELLPKPQLKHNPYTGKLNMRLWLESDVASAEKSAAFKKHFEKYSKRVNSAKKATITKYAKTERNAEEIINRIKIEKMTMEELKKLTISIQQQVYDRKELLNMEKGLYNYGFEHNAADADEATIKRWMVNTLRHNFTSYDSYFDTFKGAAGGKDAMLDIRDAILTKIGEEYPELKDECEQQIESGHSRHILELIHKV